MPDFKNKEDIENWLKGKSRQVAIAITARSSLRYLPAHMAMLDQTEVKTEVAELLLAHFRATLISGCEAVCAPPEMSGIEKAAAFSGSAFSAACTAFSAGRTMAFSDAFHARSDATDAETLETGDTRSVFQTLLWPPDQTETELLSDWQKFQASHGHSGSDWAFWCDWYQGMLNGTPMDWDLQIQVALIDPEDWDMGAAHVAGKIKEIQARFDVITTATSAQHYLTATPMPPAGVGHNNPPDDEQLEADAPEINLQEIRATLDLIAQEAGNTEPDHSKLRDSAQKLRATALVIAKWFGRKLDIAADEVFKEIGKGVGKLFNNWIVRTALAAWMLELMGVLQPVVQAIAQLVN